MKTHSPLPIDRLIEKTEGLLDFTAGALAGSSTWNECKQAVRTVKSGNHFAALQASHTALITALQDIVVKFEKTRQTVPADLSDEIRLFGKQALAAASKLAKEMEK